MKLSWSFYQSWSSNKNPLSPDGDFLRLISFMSEDLFPAEISNSLLLNFENFDPRTIFFTCSLLIFNEPKRPVLIAIFRSFVFFLLLFRSFFDKYARYNLLINTNISSRAPNDGNSSAAPSQVRIIISCSESDPLFPQWGSSHADTYGTNRARCFLRAFIFEYLKNLMDKKM